jgi:threonyl-tRNA synthetase
MPSKERLNAEYVGDDNARHTPVMLHRAVLGSLERFIGILLENFAGALPAWLHFTQAVVIPVAPSVYGYAEEVASKLAAAGIRAVADLGSDRMNAKIRLAQTQKIPYMPVVGEREAANGEVAVRFRDGREQKTMKVEDFIAYVQEKVAARFTGI